MGGVCWRAACGRRLVRAVLAGDLSTLGFDRGCEPAPADEAGSQLRTDGSGLARAADGPADRADLAGSEFKRGRFEEALSEEGSQPPTPEGGGPAELATDLVPPRGLIPAQCGCQIASS